MTPGFCVTPGEWRGVASVYDGAGQFLGHGTDRRHIKTDLGDGRTKIDVAFSGPFELEGHYVIADHGRHRIYEGPLNCGFAEALGPGLVHSDNYWPTLGLSQRFFLMVLPGGDRQLSLALLSRGERLVYAVVGENQRLATCGEPPEQVDEPCEVLLHRSGRWSGRLTSVDGNLEPVGEPLFYEERVESSGERGLRVLTEGGVYAPELAIAHYRVEGGHAFTPAGDVVGAYALWGPRARSGETHRLGAGLRIWQREVVSRNGRLKAVVHTVFRGQTRLGVQHGVLAFEAG